MSLPARPPSATWWASGDPDLAVGERVVTLPPTSTLIAGESTRINPFARGHAVTGVLSTVCWHRSAVRVAPRLTLFAVGGILAGFHWH